jgi:hypothetical protein
MTDFFYSIPAKLTDKKVCPQSCARPRKKIWMLLIFIPVSFLSFSQANSFPLNKWAKFLNTQDTIAQPAIEDIMSLLRKTDPLTAFTALNELEKKGVADNKYFDLHFKLLKADWLWAVRRWKAKPEVMHLFQQAITRAYEINKPLVIAQASWNYGQTMYDASEIELGAMYCLNAMEIWGKKGIAKGPFENFLLGEILYHTRDYKKSIYYNIRSIEATHDTSRKSREEIMSRWNTVALSWQRLKQYDSAFYYYKITMQLAEELDNVVWKGIVSGNKGQIYFEEQKYDTAKSLLTLDYLTSKKFREWDNAANSLQWVAKINLLQGNKELALQQIKEAMQLLARKNFPAYFQNICATASDIYQALGKNDSAYKYARIYSRMYDSTEKAVAGSRLEISQIKLNNLQNILVIQDLQKEKDKAALQRNFIIGAIIILAVIAVLILKSQRQKLKYQQQLASHQKTAADAELNAAKQQMALFTQNIIEKTNIIEKLDQQLNNKMLIAEQQEIMNELYNQSILTEADWEKFKLLFERIRPGFFATLTKTVSHITIAEQRMAALIYLRLSTRQIASMLGISPNSVNKTKQRLRQRINVEPETNIENVLDKM